MAINNEGTVMNQTVAIIGGDPRLKIVMEQLRKRGYTVWSRALGETSQYDFTQPVDYVILPIPGLAEDGLVKPNQSDEPVRLSADWVKSLGKDTTILVGKAPAYFKQWCEDAEISLIEYLNNDVYQVANAIPTAEGAICMAMEQMDITVHKSKCIVYGFGRCGKALAIRLKALGAQVIVVARKETDFELGRGLGLNMVHYQEVPQFLSDADCLYNTVPAMVIDQKTIALLKTSCLILDLASAPGGTDFELCQQRGIKAELATNLPGKYFPKTAGLLLADTLVQYIQHNDSLSANE